MFTDESCFRLFGVNGRERVWREPGQELMPECVQLQEHHAISIHVWAGIALNGKTELVILERNVTGETYGQLLQEHLCPLPTQPLVE